MQSKIITASFIKKDDKQKNKIIFSLQTKIIKYEKNNCTALPGYRLCRL